MVRPVVRRFDIEVGHCSQCQRRVQGQHVLQTSDALGAAGVQLGPGVVAQVVELHTEMGVPLAKVAHLLRTTFGLQVTPGGLAHVLTPPLPYPAFACFRKRLAGAGAAVLPGVSGVGALRPHVQDHDQAPYGLPGEFRVLIEIFDAFREMG